MKKLMYVAVGLAVLVACSKEQDLVQVIEQLNGSESVLATAKDFTATVATKTIITQNGSDAPTFAWKEGDVIGIIPMNGKTMQSNYEIAEIGSNPKNAKFDGGVWALKEGKEYAAYYPFKKEARVSNESIKFSFLGQRQSANNSLEHLGPYDYMYASAVVPHSGSAQFDFEHKISLVRLQLTVPKADTYTKVVIESSEPWFANEASLKLSDGTITATETGSSATIYLNNIAVSAGGILTVWFAMLPTNVLSGRTVCVKLYGRENTCTGEIAELTVFTAGSAYSYPATLVSGALAAEYEYVDLGLSVKWAACNLGVYSPEEYGGYYQWAGLEDGTSSSIDNCPYHTGTDTETGWTKYITLNKSHYWSGSGSPDNKTVLDPEDDVAYVTLGGKWRMPTRAEFQELRDNCTSEETTLNGVKGMKFTSKTNGNSIFLPAAGRFRGQRFQDAGSRGYYWSSSRSDNSPEYDSPTNAWAFVATGGWWGQTRYTRSSVRPVYGDRVNVTGVSFKSSSLNLDINETFTLSATVAPSNAAEQSVSWSSNDPSVATVDQSGTVTAISAGTTIITVRTTDGGYSSTCNVTVSSDTMIPEAVDLGLSVKWASFNLGASKPEHYGGHYQWGGLEDITGTGIILDFNVCPYHTGSRFDSGWTKYVPSNMPSYWSGADSPDNKTVLDPEDDVAHVKLGGKWRMPTGAEFLELRDNCTSEWTTLNGINGLKFTSKTNCNSIFLPAAGVYYHDSITRVGFGGDYWSSSLNTDVPYNVHTFFKDLGNTSDRCYYGHSVRPVSE